MAENPATATDLSSRSLRTLSTLELQVGATLLNDAFTILIARVPSVATRLDATPADAGFVNLVVQIECAMVLRVLNNPDGKLSETVDDYTYRLDAATSTGSLYLSDAEEVLLGEGGSASSAFTVKPAGWGVADQPDTWVSVGSANI